LEYAFRNLKLWEVSPEEFKREGLEGLLPWLPLSEEGNNQEVVEEMIAELKARDRTDLMPFGWVFAGLVLQGDEEWLRERFTAMKDLFQESPVYQWIVEEGIEKGVQLGIEKSLQQGMKQGLQKGMHQLRQMYKSVFPFLLH